MAFANRSPATLKRPPPRVGFSRWPRGRTMLLCFLAQNMTTGIAYGSFGPLLGANGAHFGVGRGVAASGMSFINLAIGLLSPVAGGLLKRLSVRTAMMLGAALSATGYGILALADVFPLAAMAYAMIGAGVSLTALLGPLTLVGRWHERNRGKMLSVVNLPLGTFVCPFLVAELLPWLGRLKVLAGMGVLFIVLAGLLAFIAEHPRSPHLNGATGEQTDAPMAGPILWTAPFWLLSLGIGVVAGTITAFLVHVVPFGIGRGMTLPAASSLISTHAAAGIAGTLFFGWIADTIGPVKTLILSAALQAILWWTLLQVGGVLYWPVVALLGLCAMPQPTLHGAAMTALFGPRAVRALGMSFAIKLPFLFGFAPLVGVLYDGSGGYRVPFVMCAAALMAAVGLFGLLIAPRRRTMVATAAPHDGAATKTRA